MDPRATPNGAPVTTIRRPIVAVFGSSTLAPTDPVYAEVRELGAGLARGGAATMTGGYDGAMAAASQGAAEAGGHVIGVTVELFEKRGPVNRWVTERVHTPDLFARLRHLVDHADGYVVVAGSIGTLNELFLVWTLASVSTHSPTPIVLMGSQWHDWLAAHREPRFVPERLHRFVQVADTPSAAAEAVLAGIATARGAR